MTGLGGRARHNHTALFFLLSYLLVMCIPLGVNIGFDYPRMREQLVQNAEERALAVSARAMDSLDTQLTQIVSLPEYIFENKRIILRDVMNTPLKCKETREELALMLQTNTFIDQLFLYIRDSDYLLSARSSSFYLSDAQQYPGIYQTRFSDWTADELRQRLTTANAQTVLAPLPVTVDGSLIPRALIFFAPVPPGRYTQATMMLCVSADHLDARIAEDELHAATLFFDRSGSLLYATESVAAASEALLRESVGDQLNGTARLRLDEREYILAWTRSKRYGWTSAQLIPMTAILSETATLQRSAMLLTLLAIAGCSALILLAMRFNYIPLRKLAQLARSVPNSNERDDFKAIRHLITTLTHENATLESRLDVTEPQAREALISQLFGGNDRDRRLAIRRASLFGVDLARESFCAVLAEYQSAEIAADACARLNAEAPEGLVRAQLDVGARGALRSDPSGFDSAPNALADCARIAYGTQVTEPAQIGLSYSAACATLDYMHMLGQSARAMRCDELPERAFNPRSYPLEVMQSLDTAISHGNADRFQELMTQIESLIALEGAPPYFTRSVYFNTINLLMGGLSRHLGDDNPTVETLGMRSMLRGYSVPEMVEILRAVAEQLLRLMTENAARYTPMSNALNYIDQNVSSPALCLQATADHVGMSPSAFSRAFKERVGRNFKEYVDAARVMRARDMLRQTDKPIEQIASAVGYDTLTSFYRLFKKMTGVAPGEYRQANQNAEIGAENE